ncbi:putative sensor histidine kinase/response regulator [Myxococcus xanthus DK 1622]|uniref:histidine kinase n=1 Tax=Myxococcus xanthus (strain DK1622) TaxID=246197 RepID=Q1DFR1_MYXXD|nr:MULTISPECIES: response regulator [Myxococcus]ABF89054.1 putative sensor histidine kinase/response regulator [Myxococcus xanthus DK 1622]NOJ56088.1 response regulator [Myxococcus xanthus]QPM79956.1 response regulator [Myxococcus xanthus]QVW69020.1 response regulator [Myxococcus xanthus DZ2]QZZ47790.1 Sensor histidine kinase RcsC [Myxococcus xanthus]
MRLPASAEPQFFDDLSREVALACDAGDTLTWVDARARNVLAANPGQTLRGLAAQGTEEKVDRLLVQAHDEKVEGWELILCRDQVPTTFAFRARPHDGGVLLVGSLVPEDYGGALERVSTTLSEMSALHRETERQQRELKRRADELARLNNELEESNRGVRSLHAALDTGIGIAPEHHERIFEEFSQVESHLQRKAKGTGLGLPLARRLTELLGGTLTVKSALGQGATFTVTLPRVHMEVTEMTGLTERSEHLDPSRAPVLVLEDDRQTLFLYEKYLARSGFQVLPVRSTDEARRVLERVRPAAMVLDVMLEGETSWGFLADMKNNEATRDIPILVVTVTDREQKARALGADEFWLKPVDEVRLQRKLQAMARTGPVERILIIDDDDVHRYLLTQLLKDMPYVLLEAAGGKEGVQLAREKSPHLIFLDFVLPDITAFDVLDELKADPRTRDVPVILHTSHELKEAERSRLAKETAAILAKHTLSREVAITRIRDALSKAGLGSQALPQEASRRG